MFFHVKQWGFVLVLSLVIVGVSALVVGGASHVGAGAEALEVERRPPPPTGGRDRFAPPVVDITRTPSGTFTGVLDSLLLAPLRTEDVSEVKFNHGGSSISLRVTFTDGSRAAFKPLQTNPQTVPRKEIAAYRINRMLGLNNVPPAAARTLHRDQLVGRLVPEAKTFLPRITTETVFDEEGFTRGAVSYWIPSIVNSKLDAQPAVEQWSRWLSVGQEIPAGKVGLMAQLSSLLLFDLLTNNSDRFSGGNLLTSPDGQRLYFMDNTFGFQNEPEGHIKCRESLHRAQKFSRRLIEAVRRIDRHSLRAALESDPGVLSSDELDGVLARREVALRYVDGLVKRHGAARVLAFP